MCMTCGCGAAGEIHHHAHPDHAHPHDRADGAASHAARVVEVMRNVLAHNDHIAAHNREWLDARGVIALNLISSPGAGKTLLLEKTLDAFNGRIPCAVIAGDQQTDRDARRLSGRGAKVFQIETGSACHLNAEQTGAALKAVAGPDTRLVFIENVGNLVCPAAFDLGEHMKVALLSVPEGEDKPVKYPALFAAARLTLLTKSDLAGPLGWDRNACRDFLRQVHPGMAIFELSAKTGDGMAAWLGYLESLL